MLDEGGDEFYIRTRLFWSFFTDRFDNAELLTGTTAQLDAMGEGSTLRERAEVVRLRLILSMEAGSAEEGLSGIRQLQEIERQLGRWGRMRRAEIDLVFGLFSIMNRPIEAAEALTEALRRFDHDTESEAMRVVFCKAVLSYVHPTQTDDPDLVREALAIAERSVFVRHDASWLRVCLAITAAQEERWDEHAELLGDLGHLGPTLAPEDLVRRAFRVACADRGRVHDEARPGLERLLAAAETNWRDSELDRVVRALEELGALLGS